MSIKSVAFAGVCGMIPTALAVYMYRNERFVEHITSGGTAAKPILDVCVRSRRGTVTLFPWYAPVALDHRGRGKPRILLFLGAKGVETHEIRPHAFLPQASSKGRLFAVAQQSVSSGICSQKL